MATRYFKYRFGGRCNLIGQSGRVYYFSMTYVTKVDDENDAEQFLRMGTPESGHYLFRETDAAGNFIGLFPPIDPKLRTSNWDVRKAPTAEGMPLATEWREVTETLADSTLYYHHIRERIR